MIVLSTNSLTKMSKMGKQKVNSNDRRKNAWDDVPIKNKKLQGKLTDQLISDSFVFGDAGAIAPKYVSKKSK